jgi:hypothetical protein
MVNQHLRRVVQRSEVLLLTRKKFQQWNADIRKDSKIVCTSTFVLSPYPVSYPINFFSYADKNTAEDRNDPEPADLGDIHMKYSS